tara:strand:- start:350 stop:751 length:402 start_codon:yes stop_codon:yes gene_type:complete
MANYNTNYVNWGGTNEQSFPYLNNDAESLLWGSLDSAWNDIQIVGNVRYDSRKDFNAKLIKRNLDKLNRKRIIKLFSRIIGKEVFNESREINKDINIDFKNIQILKGPILEKKTITLSCKLGNNTYLSKRKLV